MPRIGFIPKGVPVKLFWTRCQILRRLNFHARYVNIFVEDKDTFKGTKAAHVNKTRVDWLLIDPAGIFKTGLV